MSSVFLVWHTYSEGGADDEEVNAKLLGVYSTRAHAGRRVTRARSENGFRDWPDGFIVDEFTVDADEWEGGFVRE